MSGPTRSDLERRIESLASEVSADARKDTLTESPLDRMDEELRDFVLGVARDLVASTYETEIANLPRRERLAAVVEEMHEEYDLEENRDESVVDTAIVLAERGNRTFPSDVFMGVAKIPNYFDEETREEFDRLFENGERDAAASMMVQALYDVLARDPRQPD